MLNVALTGNVASGKTTVVQWFAGWGATVIDADQLVRAVQQPGSATLQSIGERFGAGVIRPDGTLDRDALRQRVMGDEDALATLNAIVHPAVRRRRAALAAAAVQRGDCVLVNDIPLLFEVLDPGDFDLVVLVDAPVEVRRERLVSTRGLSHNEADLLIRSQLPSERKRIRSDIVIGNAETLEALERAAREAWGTIRSRAAKAAAGDGQSLLAVFAHAGDEACAVGGTLARYADAGIATHLVCAMKAGVALQHAAEVLGLGTVTVLDYTGGGIHPDDAHGTEAVGKAIRRVAPGAVITFGPAGGSGHEDHVAVHTWTRNAWAAAGSPCPLYYVAYPAEVARKLPGRLHGTPEEQLAARLDVRPWRDVKQAATAAYDRLNEPCDLLDQSALPPSDHEWYTAESPPERTLADLYQTSTSAVDSPRTAG